MKQWLAEARTQLEHRRRGFLRDRETSPEVEMLAVEPPLGIRALAIPSADAGRELSHVIAALCRLASRTYGRCTTCGKAIARERLAASPEAPRCFSCETGWAADAQVAARRGPRARLALNPSRS
jgi:RNA polymerase-binding transcription factor DksA